MSFFVYAEQAINWLDGRNPLQQEANTKWKQFMSHLLRMSVFLCLCLIVYAISAYVYLLVDVVLMALFMIGGFIPGIGEVIFLIDLTGTSTYISASLTISICLAMCYMSFVYTNILSSFAFWFQGKHITLIFWFLCLVFFNEMLFSPEEQLNTPSVSLSFMILGLFICWLFSNRWRSFLLSISILGVFLVLIPLLLIAEGKLPVDILFNPNTKQFFKPIKSDIANAPFQLDYRTPEEFYNQPLLYSVCSISETSKEVSQARFRLGMGRAGKVGSVKSSNGFSSKLKAHNVAMHNKMSSPIRLTNTLKLFKIKIPKVVHNTLKPVQLAVKGITKPIRQALAPVRNVLRAGTKRFGNALSRKFSKPKTNLAANGKTPEANARAAKKAGEASVKQMQKSSTVKQAGVAKPKTSFVDTVKSFGHRVRTSSTNAFNSAKQYVKFYRRDYNAKCLTKTLQRPENIKGFANAKQLKEHWKNHANEFPKLKNKQEYQAKAQDFFKNPPKGTLTGVRGKEFGPEFAGDIVQYHPKSNTFGIMSKGGTVRTAFKPNPEIHGFKTNKEYFYDALKFKE